MTLGQDWSVLEHGPLLTLAENIWWVDGTVPRLPLRRCMTVARASDGRLIIHNAIALNEQAMTELLALGEPAWLLVPNGYHRIDAPAYKKRFPALRVLAPRGSRAKVVEVVTVDGSYEDFSADGSVQLEPLPGVGETEGFMRVRSNDGITIVLNDVVFNMDSRRNLFGRLVTTLMGSAPGPRVPRLAKMTFIKDKLALRRKLEELAETPGLIRLIVAHEKIASGVDAAAALRLAATFL
jgi:hypothetical protein